MYRNDAGRTGYTTEPAPTSLHLLWTHQPPHPPLPAWPRSDRMTFDRAFQVVVVGELVIFGSSADGIVYALHADSGEVAWTFPTDGPIRFAPAAWRDRVFVASDDGFLYALSQASGRLLWKRRGGPDGSLVLGNGRLISKWPARGGPVVVDDVVYFAAGIWPSEGIFLYALQPESGQVVWCNDRSGGIDMPQPHPGANAASGVAAQGYLTAAGERLLMPTGRAVPAGFDRQTGEFAYFHLQQFGRYGSAEALAVDDQFVNSGLSFRSQDGQLTDKLGAGLVAAAPGRLFRAAGSQISIYRWEDGDQADRKGQPVPGKSLVPDGALDAAADVTCLVVAGETLVCGTPGGLTLIDRPSQQAVAKARIDGTVLGLAVAAGKLFVSTDDGRIHCFGDADVVSPKVVAASPMLDELEGVYGQAADEIIRRTGVTAGYCLDLGCGDGSLAIALARRTELQVFAVDDDPAKVAAVRKRLIAAGLYGHRVTVQHRDLAATGYPQYFADLVVSSRSMDQAAATGPTPEMQRVQRPSGGSVCLGPPSDLVIDIRPPLTGAGNWTHQYADPGNTLTSDDALVAGRLGVLWFRDVDFDIPQRHGRAPAPLYDAGRLFHGGLHGVIAVDAYNGRELWRHEIPELLTAYDGDELMGTAGTGGVFCIDGRNLFVRHQERCQRLDAASGKLLGEFSAPSTADGQGGDWGYVAAVDGTLYGSVTNREHVVTYRYRDTTGDMSRLHTESRALFAMDGQSGQLRWQFDAEHSIRHNAIAIGKGKMFVIDRPLAMFDREKKPASKQHAAGRLLALDTGTGKPLWQTEEDVYGTLLAVSEKHDVLLMSYQPTRFRLDSELGGRMTAFRASTGERLWEVTGDYQSRPLINDDVVYTQGGAWGLLDGEPRPFAFQRSYGCGTLAASRNMLLFRSATLGYSNFGADSQVENYGGIRPGCWINTLPVGGLVLVPDATAGCSCSYLNRAWIALTPMP